MSVVTKETIEHILFNAIELTNDAIGIFDKNDNVVFCNQSFSDIFAQPEQACLNQNFEQLIRSCFERKEGVKIDSTCIETWLDMARDKRRSSTYRSFEIDTCDDRWFRLTEMMVDEFLFSYATDITASKNLQIELVKTKNKLQQLASTDHLTGIYNRRQFYKLAEQELLRCDRSKLPATLVLLDLDHFKQINDTYGHACGDAVLVSFTDRIKGELRSYDIFARIGGEEFAILLPEANEEEAFNIAQRYLNKVTDVPFYYEGEYIHSTVSIGLSESYPKIKTLDYALKTADQRLYQAKQSGRNQVVGPNS